MAEVNYDNFAIQLQAIGEKLKKRLFRKPNIGEALELYETLYKDILSAEQKEFAAICSLEQAKCYASAQNTFGQINSLTRAAKDMLDANREYKNFEARDADVPYGSKMGTRADGQVQVVVEALQQARQRYDCMDHHTLVLLFDMRIGEILVANNYYDQGLKYFEEALKIATEHFTLADQLAIVERVVWCKVKTSELESASQIVVEYLDKVKKMPPEEGPNMTCKNFVLKFEITRVCLVLILGGDTTDLISFIWPNETITTKDQPLTSTSESADADAPVVDEEERLVTIYLKSLALAVQHGSVPEIHIAHNSLVPFLDDVHEELFRTLIQIQS